MDHEYERGILVVSMPEDKVMKSVNGKLIEIASHRMRAIERADVRYLFCTNDLEKYDSYISKKHNINGRQVHFMDVNRYSKNIIVVQFPQGTGGSFLMSCLNLSNDVAKYISKDDKKSYIKQILYRSKTRSEHYDPVNFSFCWDVDDVEKSINSDEFTFILSHHYDQEDIFKCTPTKKVVNFFHNAKVLKFENWIPFYIIRRFLPGISFDEYLKATPEKRKELFSSVNTKHDSNLIPHLNAPKNVGDYTWDTFNFFDRKRFLNGIEKLYDDIGLSGFDSELIGSYYDEWIVVMRNWGNSFFNLMGSIK